SRSPGHGRAALPSSSHQRRKLGTSGGRPSTLAPCWPAQRRASHSAVSREGRPPQAAKGGSSSSLLVRCSSAVQPACVTVTLSHSSRGTGLGTSGSFPAAHPVGGQGGRLGGAVDLLLQPGQ